MELSLKQKIQIGLILAIGCVVFGVLGRALLMPNDPAYPMTLVCHAHSVLSWGWLFILAFGATLLSIPCGGKYAAHTAVLAIGAGLSCWAVLGGDFNALLLDYRLPAERAVLFRSLMVETVGIFILTLAGYALAVFVGRYRYKHLPVMPFRCEPPDILKPAPSRESASNPKFVSYSWSVLGVLFAVLAGSFLLTVFARSEQAYTSSLVSGHVALAIVPRTGQILFSVFAAFFLASLAAQQLFRLTWSQLLLVPLITAAGIYFLAGEAAAGAGSITKEASPFLLLPSMRTAVILPCQYLGVGFLAVIGGYWMSLRIRYKKKVLLENPQ